MSVSPEMARAAVSIRDKYLEGAQSSDGPLEFFSGGELKMGAVGLKGLAAGFGVMAAKNTTKEALTKGGVYVLRDNLGNIVRSGRTSSLIRRQLEHERDPTLGQFRFEPIYKTDSYEARRGLEQMLHEEHNPILNKINPISPSNPNRESYMNSAREFRGGAE